MRKLNIITLILIGFLISSCSDKIEETYKINTPVYMTFDELRASFDVKEAQDIIQPGKIYFRGDFIFVNEYQKGIHVVNNADPSNPVVEKFIDIPGNVDLAVKGNMLYADSYIDLLTIDISDLNNIVEIDRDTSVFPYILPEFEGGILDQVNYESGVVIGYTVTEKTEEVEAYNNDYGYYSTIDRGFLANDVMAFSESGGVDKSGGTGGSMARFTLFADYLYIVDNASLHLFNVSNNANPVFEKNITISWNIETIFPYNNMLFIGSQTGMFVYGLQNPANPEFISEFRHASACDPVVVEGDYAYVTLRGGNLCGAIESQLDVIDISTIEYPQLLKTYPMEEPYGLGIKNDVLFVCDGDAGLKVYNATDKMKIDSNMVAHYSDINAFDVIPLQDVLIMIGVDGLYQYDYADLENITQLSFIPIYGD
ncbi:MAG: hypothetical protein PF517_20400 [Salinivirgaceae bacterium]|jgi:hypothetical protein|nr:hypothetical protein [Salinivirgaceae bacterium]